MDNSRDKGAYQDLLLGRHTEYEDRYNAGLLQPIPRAELRATLGIESDLPFTGVDIWTAYEVSWLNARGKPQVAIADFHIPCHSPYLIESKSFKLYLNSLNQTVFSSEGELVATLEKDLSAMVAAPVMVMFKSLLHATADGVGRLTGKCLDELDVEIDRYSPAPELLGVVDSAHEVSEALYSHLLKSNCPVTGQPDWASIWVEYRGAPINREALLKYIVSYREHQDFHEHCVEQIFMDIKRRCQPRELTVYARYTRRGGLDINPFRSDCDARPSDIRLVRQ